MIYRFYVCFWTMITLMIFPVIGYACMCSTPPLEQRIIQSDVIFSGKIYEIQGSSGGRCGAKTAQIKVAKSWKGNVEEIVAVSTSDACSGCGLYLSSGDEYLIFGSMRNGVVQAYGCSGSMPLSRAAEQIAEMESYFEQVKALNSAIQNSPESIEPLFLKAEYYLEKKDYNEARKLFEKLTAMPDAKKHAQIWNAYGQSLEQLKQLDKAVDAYKHAYESAPKDASIRSNYDMARLKNGVDSKEIFPNGDASHLSFKGREISNITLEGVDLTDVDFSGSQLTSVVFDNVSLTRGDFSNAWLHRVSFKNNATLDNVKFKKVAFGKVLFEDVMISESEFIDYVSGRTYEMQMRNVEFKAVIFRNLRFGGIVLDGVTFDSVSFENTYMGGEHKNVQFFNTKFKNVQAWYSSLSNIEFNNVEIDNLDLKGGQLSDVKFKNSVLKKLKIYQGEIEKTEFLNSQLTEGGFFSVAFRGVRFKDMDIVPLISSVGAFDEDEYERIQQGRPSSTMRSYMRSNESNNRYGRSHDDVTNLYMATYDCETVWPNGFSPSEAGAVLADKECDLEHEPVNMQYGSYGLGNYHSKRSTKSFGGGRIPPPPDFSNGLLQKANLSNMVLKGVSFKNANLSGVDLSNTELFEVNLEGADLSDALMDGLTLEHSTYDCKTVWPQGFDYAAVGAISTDINCTIPVDLRGRSFREKNLEGALFINSNLEGVRFERVILKNANLSGSNVSWVNMGGSNLSGAILNKTNFSNTNLSSVNFENVDFSSAILTEAIMSSVTLNNVDLRKTNHEGRIMSGARFVDANAEGVNFKKARLEKAVFIGANLKNADFSGANLRGAQFQAVPHRYMFSMDGRMHKRQTAKEFVPNPANLQNVNFANVDLEEAILGDVDLSSANLDGANLLLAKFGCNAKWPDGFSPTEHGAIAQGECEKMLPTNLEGGNFSKRHFVAVDLKGVNLKGANLRHSTFGGVNLEGADMQGANLSRAIFGEVSFKGANLSNVNMMLAQYSCHQTKFPEGFDPGKYGAIARGGRCKGGVYSLPNLSGKDLKGNDLSNLSLVEVDLSNADLRGSSFSRSDLTRANLSGAKLQGIDFYGATLHDINFEKAEYDCATKWPRGFDRSKLSEAVNMADECAKPAPLKEGQVRLDVRDLIRSPNVNVQRKEKVDLSGQDLRGMNLWNANLTNANLSGVKADWVRFRHLRGVNLSNASLRGATINGGLSGANLEGADLTHATIITDEIGGINLKNTKVFNANLDIRIVTKGSHGVDKIDLTGVRYDCRTVWRSRNKDFDPRNNGAILVGEECNSK